MKIGILGGTFNPIHTGHLILAEEVHRLLRLDKVLFIPCYLPPHKSSKGLISARHRLEMVKLAIRHNPHFALSEIEVNVKKKSYTAVTLEKLKRNFLPRTKLFLIVGSDALEELPHWRDFTKIIKLAKLVIARRPKFPVKRVMFAHISVQIPLIDISSSEIRRRIRKNLSIRYIVPESVEGYILKKKLYSYH